MLILSYAALSFFFSQEEIDTACQSEVAYKALNAQYLKKAFEYSVNTGSRIAFDWEEVDGIKIIDRTSLQVEYIQDEFEIESMVRLDGYLERIKKIFKTHFYAEEKENFSHYTAIKQAKDAGAEYLILENLS